jgi:hypothetical protein
MVSINPLISFTEPITRQDLFDMWSTGALSGITVDDFAEGFLPIVVGSSFSEAPQTPQPGQLYWHQAENLMFCWTDEIEGTGVSLWLSIGPDRFDAAMLTKSVVACGEGVELVGPGRVVQAIIPAEVSRTEFPVVCGFNQSGINNPPELIGGQEPVEPLVNASGETYWMGETAISDTWIAVGIDGFVYMGSCPGSHPSEALSAWSNQGAVIMNSVPGLPAGVLRSNDITDPFGHIVGGTVAYNLKADSLARTEPWWLTRVSFMPRASRGTYFET